MINTRHKSKEKNISLVCYYHNLQQNQQVTYNR